MSSGVIGELMSVGGEVRQAVDTMMANQGMQRDQQQAGVAGSGAECWMCHPG
jgi:hypothetical protein